MSGFTKPWKAICEGIERILGKHSLPGKIEYAGRDKYDNADLYVVIRTDHDTAVVSDFLDAFRSEPVFEGVAGRDDEIGYYEQVWDPEYHMNFPVGPYDKFSFNLDVTVDSDPVTFYKQYQPDSFTSIHGIGVSNAETLHGAGYSSPSEVTQDDISDIAAIDGIGRSTVSTLCSVLDLKRPGDDDGDPVDSFDTLTERQATLFRDAGYDTINDLDTASNEELLDIHGVGNAVVWEIRNALSDHGTTPDICRLG